MRLVENTSDVVGPVRYGSGRCQKFKTHPGGVCVDIWGGCGLGELLSANRSSSRSHPTFAPIGMTVTDSGSTMVLASRLCRVELLFLG